MKYLQALYYMYYINVIYYDYNFNREVVENKNKKYMKEFACFDIETTALHDIAQSFMYVWQFYIDGVVVVGRTWNEFIDFIKTIQEIIGVYKLVVYVHNLSYEFQFLAGIYNFITEQVFAVKSRKVLKAQMGNIEFRCSYLLSNMSLAEYTNKMQVVNKKLTGELDYDRIRYSDTELEHTELAYCINDVLGLYQAISKEMELSKDNVITIPLTSTGYVRRDCKKVMWKYKKTLVKKIYPTYKCYQLLREAFRGGNTHANRYYNGIIIKNVKSMDISSSYPYVINNLKFPIGKFRQMEAHTQKELENYIAKGKACLCKVILENIRLKDELWGAPYLSLDKCRGVTDYINDNGRIIQAEMLETTITDIDYNIIKSEYDFDTCYVKELFITEYGDIPKELKDVVNKYYIDKTELKGIKEQEVYYTKQKNKLNSIYGMMAQNPVKQNTDFINGQFIEQENDEWTLLLDSVETSFLPYQWGVWTTAHARNQLEKGIQMAGHNFVYCDTDSVKYIGEIDGLDDFNAEAMYNSEINGSYAKDRKGITHFMGMYENDGYYDEFITYGAKKYAYVIKGKLGITIAGVNKNLGAEELTASGGLKKLKIGYIFKKAGGLEMTYNDDCFGWYKKDGHTVYITRNIYVHNSTYKLSVTTEYADLIENCKYATQHLLHNY